jgi:hypothetical protein
MPDKGPASEFGGKVVSRHGVQPPPHVPSESERLSLLYRTGDESGLVDVDNGDVFAGLLTEERQTAIREAEGVLRKGEAWDELISEGQSSVDELRTDQG